LRIGLAGLAGLASLRAGLLIGLACGLRGTLRCLPGANLPRRSLR